MENEKTTIDDLAVMIKEGFDGMSESMSEQFKGVTEEFKKVNTRLDTLEVGQEDIKLRLDNTAHRFEVVELAKRVTVLEEHAGIKK